MSRARGQEPAPGWDLGRWQAMTALAGIVIVAGYLRFHALLRKPTWADEMWTLRNIYTSDWGELLRVAFDDYWPPLYYLILNGVTRIADTGLLWLRLPSVIFGVATVAIMYPLGRRLFGNRFQALVATALLAGMTSHVLYSQEARVYSLQVLLAVLSAWTFYTSYWDRRVSGAFLVSTTLLTYTHSFASWYFIAAQGAYVLVGWLLWRDREALRKGLLSQALVLLLWLPLVGAFAWARFARSIVVPTQWATAPDNPAWVMGFLEQYQGLAIRSWVGAGMMVVLVALAMLELGRAVWARREARPITTPESVHPSTAERAVVFLLCWCLAPVLFSMAVTGATSMHTFPEIRYHLAVLPGICLLAAGGLTAVRSPLARTGIAGMLVLVPAAELPRYYTEFNRPAIDEAAAIVLEYRTPTEPIYASGDFRAFAYYFRGSFPRIGSAEWDALAASTAHLTDRYTLNSVKWGDTYAFEKLPPHVRSFVYFFPPPQERIEEFVDWEAGLGGFSSSFWVVQAAPPAPANNLLAVLGARCAVTRTWSVRGLTVTHCRGASETPPGAALSVAGQ